MTRLKCICRAKIRLTSARTSANAGSIVNKKFKSNLMKPNSQNTQISWNSSP